MDEASMTKEERIRYEGSLKYYLDEMDSIEYYEAKGRAEGEAIGEARGEARGKEEAFLEAACNLKQMGLSSEDISKATNLPKYIVEKL